MTRRFDAIIIGAGQAGPPLAGRLTAAGKTVALIERHLFGGTCVNTGCMPTKTLVASAHAAYAARRANDFGITLGGEVAVDMARVKARADKVVLDARTGLEHWICAMEKCTVFRGHASLEGGNAVRIADKIIEGDQIFINVGCRAVVPSMPGIDVVPVLTNVSILSLTEIPKHLVVIGGSYIGLEFAQMYRRFGAQVTVVEKGARLVGREDEDVSSAVQDILEREGIAFRLGAECIHFSQHVDGVEVGVECMSGDRKVVGSHVLLAVGRRPNTDDLGLARAGVEVDAHGWIAVDDQLRTSAPNVWAMGDCNGRGAFTHTAYNDFEIVAANLLDNEPRRVSDRLPTYALYVDPPLGRVGMTEAEAVATGRPVLVGRRSMERVGRAVEKGETLGFMKVVVDAESHLILGASILGTGGDEAVHGILDMMYANAPYETLQRSVAIHPTVSELIPTMLGEMQPLA